MRRHTLTCLLYTSRSYLALGGVSGKALDRFLSERKDTQKVFLCLDLSLIHISVDLMFEELAEKDPDHLAVRQYAKYKLAAGVVCSKSCLLYTSFAVCGMAE